MVSNVGEYLPQLQFYYQIVTIQRTGFRIRVMVLLVVKVTDASSGINHV